MNIKELKEVIKDLPDDMTVISVGVDVMDHPTGGDNIITAVKDNQFYICHDEYSLYNSNIVALKL